MTIISWKLILKYAGAWSEANYVIDKYVNVIHNLCVTLFSSCSESFFFVSCKEWGTWIKKKIHDGIIQSWNWEIWQFLPREPQLFTSKLVATLFMPF
jgi:hypothetical protein